MDRFYCFDKDVQRIAFLQTKIDLLDNRDSIHQQFGTSNI